MSDKMREEFERLFQDFADGYDTYGNEWQDMPLNEVFIAGCIASRKAIKVELPGHVNDMDSAPMLYESITEQLTKAGISYD